MVKNGSQSKVLYLYCCVSKVVEDDYPLDFTELRTDCSGLCVKEAQIGVDWRFEADS